MLFRICNKDNLISIRSLNKVIQKSELVENILPMSDNIILDCLTFTAPVSLGSKYRIKEYLAN